MEPRWSTYIQMATKESAIVYLYVPPSLISLHLVCSLAPIFIGQCCSSGTKDFFFVSFFQLQRLSIDYYNTKSRCNCSFTQEILECGCSTISFIGKLCEIVIIRVYLILTDEILSQDSSEFYPNPFGLSFNQRMAVQKRYIFGKNIFLSCFTKQL